MAAPKKPTGNKPPVEKAKAPKGYIVADGGVYICMKKCTYGIQMYRDKNDVGGPSKLKVPKGTLIPHHFKKAKVQPEDDDD